MTRTSIAIAAAAILVLGAGLVLFRSTGAHRAGPSDARQVARGAAVYADRCAVCHGRDLEGQPNWQARKADGLLPAPPHDATGHTWHHPDAQLFAITKFGLVPPIAPEGYRSEMPAFAATLSDDDIWAVLAYIESRWPADIRDRHRQIDAAAR
ncbi:MAG: c-type cytochrome [Gemmatimonas sp.]